MPRKRKAPEQPVQQTVEPSVAVIRPDHSPFGGSGADRWINCSGSYALLQAIGSSAAEAPEYQKDGSKAHELAEKMLKEGIAESWQLGVSMEMGDAIQVYVNYVRLRSAGKRALVEYEISHPKFHPLVYGRLDAVIFEPEPDIALEIIDYKHGAGVVVEVVENSQERFYAGTLIAGDTWPMDLLRLQDMDRVKLTVVQPRAFSSDGQAIHSWVLTVGEIINWMHNIVSPAIQRAMDDHGKSFSTGEWCRFCPAKLACPAHRKLAADAMLVQAELLKPVEEFNLAATDDEWLSYWYSKLSALDMFKKAIREETERRVKGGKAIASAKLVFAKVNRIFKPEAIVRPVVDGVEYASPIEARFGQEAWIKPEIRSPASIEDLPGGKEFCAEWAMKPKAGLTVAPITDARSAQKFLGNEEAFKDVLTSH